MLLVKEIPMGEPRAVAVVTGASRGLGRVIADVLRRRGFDLVVNSRDAGALRRAADGLRTGGAHVVEVAGDVTDAGVRGRIANAARARGGLDVLVNNASELGTIGPLTQFDPLRFARVFGVNAVAPIALIQLTVPLLSDRHGLIVNVTSDAAKGAYPGWGPYGASKAALELLTLTLTAELKDDGVSAVVVDPGDMRTQMHQDAFPDEDISDRPLPEVTAPFWNWLFDQDPSGISGKRFVAQSKDAPWLQPA
jgi:NAD(P)-dependent dehydrogenase (short-subunit alcohol dehydrogenase family)